MAPRRPASFHHGVPYPIPPQEGRQASLASLPVTTSSLWQPAQPVHPGHPFSRTLPSNAHLLPAAPLPSNNPLTAKILSSNIPPPMVRLTAPSQGPSQRYSSSFSGSANSEKNSYHQTVQTPVPVSLTENPSAELRTEMGAEKRELYDRTLHEYDRLLRFGLEPGI
ncbi:hypothetical protein B0T10DRAFT_588133 [Thelonectria olida]|uniref:Uncharacterized protein n=1 Tax=Thelonectria olida TaxID=1576542 RepID=A0A9P9AJA7_9HYPO|nr:hypothetical protein B0T10DRAFT_588133 [Thelonectria olida]